MKDEAQSRDRRDGNTVTFRLQLDALHVLVGRAKLLGVSRHQLAQLYVLQMLALEETQGDLTAGFEAVRKDITEMRAEIALGVEALLLTSGKYEPQEARKWVQSQFHIPIADLKAPAK